MRSHSPGTVKAFFARSDLLDYLVLRPLSHISTSWEATWEGNRYRPEEGSFADDLNFVINAIAVSRRPERYHDHEDRLAENVLLKLKWPIQKKGRLWIGADYQTILEQGAFSLGGKLDLISAANGRTQAALDRQGQGHFDRMDDRHRWMLSGLMTMVIYHRYCDGTRLFDEDAS